MKRRGFSLLELLVALAIIAAVIAIAVPVYKRARHNALAAECISHLRQLGVALNLYLAEHRMTLPPLVAARSSKDEPLPAIDNTLDAYTETDAVFACPADFEGIAQRTGTSYFWNSAVSGQNVAALNFLNLIEDASRIPLISDKEGFHPYRDNKVNILYADGHATQELQFFTED